jgi:Protein of unknown function (DUF3313)
MHMKTAHILIVLLLAASIQGCGTVMTTPDSHFLSSYARMTESAGAPSSSARTMVLLDPSQITFDIQWRASAQISVEEQSELMAQLRGELQDRVDAMPRSVNGHGAILRAAITRVETVSPPLNTLAALLLVVPIDRGGAAVEIEAVDPDSGKQFAALRLGYFAPITDLRARFHKLAPAEIALKKAADDFVPLLQAPTATSLSAL